MWSNAFDRSLDLRTHTLPSSRGGGGGGVGFARILRLPRFKNIHEHITPFHGSMITHFTTYHPRICELAPYHFVGPQTPILPLRGLTSTLRTISWPHEHSSYHFVASRTLFVPFRGFTNTLRTISWPQEHPSCHFVASRAPFEPFCGLTTTRLTILWPHEHPFYTSEADDHTSYHSVS